MTTATLKRLKTLITWFGGKQRMVPKLLRLLPPHHTYVEPFGGAASLLVAKRPSAVEVYNDIDSALVNFFRVLRDPTRARAFRRLCELTPYSREAHGYCLDRLYRDQQRSVALAHRLFVVLRQGFGGEIGPTWGYTITSSSRGMGSRVSAWHSAIERLPEVIARLRCVQIANDDGARVIERFDTPQTCHYVDPPYVWATRRSGGYSHELTDDDHRRLVQVLLDAQGMVMLSGYRNDIYAPLEAADWRRFEFDVRSTACGHTRHNKRLGTSADSDRRTECIWLNPAATAALASAN